MRAFVCTAIAGLLVACSSQVNEPEYPSTTMRALAAELLDRAESRADLGRMVVSVHGVAEAGLDAGSSRSDSVVYYGSPPRRAVGDELERELLLSLGDRVRTLEPDWTGTELPARDLERALAETRATHLVVGDYVQHGAVLRVSLRLIEVKTGLIVATSNGVMPLERLSDRGRQAAYGAPPRHQSSVALASPAAEVGSVQPATATIRTASSGGPALQRSSLPAGGAASPSSRVRASRRGGPAFFRWTAAARPRR